MLIEIRIKAFEILHYCFRMNTVYNNDFLLLILARTAKIADERAVCFNLQEKMKQLRNQRKSYSLFSSNEEVKIVNEETAGLLQKSKTRKTSSTAPKKLKCQRNRIKEARKTT